VWGVGWAGTFLHRSTNLTWSVVPPPTGVTEGLNSVWGTAANNVWAVGNQERILHYDGASWTSVRGSPSGMHLRTVWGRAANDVWAAGGDSQGSRAIALHYDGTRWTDASPRGDALRSIWGPTTGTSAYAVGNQEIGDTTTIWTVGASTITLDTSGVLGRVVALGGAGGSNVWGAGEAGILLHNDGNGWAKISSTVVERVFLNGAWMAGPDEGWAVGSNGTILRFHGGHWQVSPSGVGWDLIAVHGTSASDVWAGGANDELLHWDGHTWTPVTGFDSGGAVTAVRAVAPNDVWIGFIASTPRIHHWDGSTWKKTAYAGPAQIYGFWSSTSGDVWALASYAYRYDGSTWNQVPSGTAAGLRAMWGASAGDAWIAGAGGILMHWNGTDLSPTQSPVTDDLLAIHGAGANDIRAVGENGSILHFDGKNWTAESADTGLELRAIANDGAGTARIFSDGTGILRKAKP
jgi:hypothetical protein